MDYFLHKEGRLYAEDVAVSDIARRFGTPCYVYSRATIERHWRAFDDALSQHAHLVCYAVKANSNIAVLNILARLGSGFDIVSVGELERVLRAGGEPSKIVFSGVGKRADEMQRALEVGIYSFNVESESELRRLNDVAEALGKRAPVSLRVNPDVDANTHPYIATGLKENKFGIDISRSREVYRTAARLKNIELLGVDCHIGSQLTEEAPFVAALERVLALLAALQTDGIELRHLNLGGGLGVRYRDETPPLPAEYARALATALDGRTYKLIIEPGRAIVANAGILVTRVEYLKRSEYKNFAIVDAAMNDLLRPSLYSAWQEIVCVEPAQDKQDRYDIVGPVCETGDFLGKDRELALQEGDFLAVRSAGAYGFTMSSNYNSRPRVAEVLVDNDTAHLIRRREELAELFAGEQIIPE